MSESANVQWSQMKLILSRFGVLYFIQYFLYTFLSIFRLPSPFSGLPITSDIATYYSNFLKHIGVWVGNTVFNKKITAFTLGSGDTTFDYIMVLCFITFSLVGTIIWTLVDRKRLNYSRLMHYIHVILRYSIAIILIGYGVAKVIPTQFMSPLLYKLLQPFGDASPMGLAWSFMGSSYPFTIYTGFGELIGAILLLFRRTTNLGAMILVSVMSTVVMMNLSYDIPVKLYSMHILLACLLILLPDAERLINFFLLDRDAIPTKYPPLFESSKLAKRLMIAGKVILFSFIALKLFNAYQIQQRFGDLAPKPNFYGIWNVEELKIDGEIQPPTLSNEKRWRRVVFNQINLLSVQLVNDEFLHFGLKDDSSKKTFDLISRRLGKGKLEYKTPSSDELILSGTIQNKPIQAKLKLVKNREFLLRERGFNWVNETPLNR